MLTVFLCLRSPSPQPSPQKGEGADSVLLSGEKVSLWYVLEGVIRKSRCGTFGPLSLWVRG